MAGHSKESQAYEEAKDFFESAPPLKDSDDIKGKIEEFVERKSSVTENGKLSRVVCVTSGGTTVPLEQRCVRYIDNFSSGNRGAASTEYFLKSGYSVIFLYRRPGLVCFALYYIFQFHAISCFIPDSLKVMIIEYSCRGTCQPYCRSLPDDPLLQCFDISADSNIQVLPKHEEAVKSAITEHQAAVSGGLLLKLPFTTIFEYLQMLQLIAISARKIGTNALFYLAAAVSDFYVPWETMTLHKIQSASGPLDMRLAQVPKMLSVLRKEWAPMAFCISFKLETDSKILLEKASMALKKYMVHMVVANELSTRKEEVIVVSENGNIVVHRDKAQEGADVEDPLIKLVVDRHSAYIQQACK